VRGLVRTLIGFLFLLGTVTQAAPGDLLLQLETSTGRTDPIRVSPQDGYLLRWSGGVIQTVAPYAPAPNLSAIAGLTSAADTFPYFTGSGTASLATITSLARNLLDDTTQGAMHTTLGLVPGTNVQAYHANLAALAGLTNTANAFPYFNGTNMTNLASGATGRSLLEAAGASGAKATIGLSNIIGGTDLSILYTISDVNRSVSIHPPRLSASPLQGILRFNSSGPLGEWSYGIFTPMPQDGLDIVLNLPTLTSGIHTLLHTTGSGASLTGLNATQLTSGTVPDARLTANLTALAGLTNTANAFPYFNGTGMTNLASGATGRSLLEAANQSAAKSAIGLAGVSSSLEGSTQQLVAGANTRGWTLITPNDTTGADGSLSWSYNSNVFTLAVPTVSANRTISLPSATGTLLLTTGNGSALTGLTKTQVGLANVENTALSTWAGSTNLTTLGTITSGTWNGTTIPVSHGGTGITSLGANVATWLGTPTLANLNAAVSTTIISGGVGSTANAVPRADGTGGGTLKSSSMTIADNGNVLVSGATSFTVPMLAVGNVNTGIASIEATRLDLVVDGVNQLIINKFGWISTSAVVGIEAPAFSFTDRDGPRLQDATIATKLVMSQHNGLTAQRFQVANTWTSATNHEAAVLDWQTTANTLRIGTDKGSDAGLTRDVHLVRGGIKLAALTDNAVEIGGGATAADLRLMEPSGSGTNYTGFKAPALAADVIYTLPTADGTAGQFLKTDGSKVLSWDSPAGAGTVTSVGGTGTVNGLTLTGTVTSSGDLTLGGTLTGTAGAYDATSWNGDNAPPTKDAVRDKIEAMSLVTFATKTADYTLDPADSVILVNAASGNVTITFPAAAGATGKAYTIKRIDSSSNTVTLDPNASETIDGNTTIIFGSQWDSLSVFSDGSNWIIY